MFSFLAIERSMEMLSLFIILSDEMKYNEIYILKNEQGKYDWF